MQTVTKIYLLGQLMRLQLANLVAINVSGQKAPPLEGLGLVQLRILVLNPVAPAPHDTVHDGGPHGPHMVNPPLT